MGIPSDSVNVEKTLEQALTAMLAAKEERLAVPASDYVVLPSVREGEDADCDTPPLCRSFHAILLSAWLAECQSLPHEVNNHGSTTRISTHSLLQR